MYSNLIKHYVEAIFVHPDLGTGQGLSTEQEHQKLLENLHKLVQIIDLHVKKVNNNLVLSTFWGHSGLILNIAHYYIYSLVHLYQNKFGKERNTIPNDLD